MCVYVARMRECMRYFQWIFTSSNDDEPIYVPYCTLHKAILLTHTTYTMWDKSIRPIVAGACVLIGVNYWHLLETYDIIMKTLFSNEEQFRIPMNMRE